MLPTRATLFDLKLALTAGVVVIVSEFGLQERNGPWEAAGPARPAFELIGADEA